MKKPIFKDGTSRFKEVYFLGHRVYFTIDCHCGYITKGFCALDAVCIGRVCEKCGSVHRIRFHEHACFVCPWKVDCLTLPRVDTWGK